MKKLIAILVTLALLLTMAGCQKSSGRSRRDDDDDDDRAGSGRYDNGGVFFPGMTGEEDDDENGGEIAFPGEMEDGETGDNADAMPFPGTDSRVEGVAYESILVDNSIRNDNDDILVRREYVKIVLLDEDPACEAINAQIEADCESFLNSDLYWTVEELEETLESFGYGYDAFFNTAAATVLHNGDGFISIRITTDWFMGGVFNCNSYGLTYDLTTGEEARIEDVMDLPADEALEQLKELSAERLVEYYGEEGLLVDPAEVLAGYTLEDFRFYLENGELVLSFYTYEFACGAAGPANIHTGIYVGG